MSILVPVYNELGYTVECIGSIPRSRPKVSYELIVADDASPDPAIARLGTIKNLRYVAQPTNLGFLENSTRRSTPAAASSPAAQQRCPTAGRRAGRHGGDAGRQPRRGGRRTEDPLPERPAAGSRLRHRPRWLHHHGRAVRRPQPALLQLPPRRPLLLRRGAAGQAQRNRRCAVRQDLHACLLRGRGSVPAPAIPRPARRLLPGGRGRSPPQCLHQQAIRHQAAATRRPQSAETAAEMAGAVGRPEQGPGDRLLPPQYTPPRRTTFSGARGSPSGPTSPRPPPAMRPLPAAFACRSRLLRPPPAPNVRASGGPGAPLRDQRLLRVLLQFRTPPRSGRSVRGDRRRPVHRFPVLRLLGQRELDPALGRRHTGHDSSRHPMPTPCRASRRRRPLCRRSALYPRQQPADVPGLPPLLLPDARSRRACRDAFRAGFPGVYLLRREHETAGYGARRRLGFDACVEFPPRAVPSGWTTSRSCAPGLVGTRYD